MRTRSPLGLSLPSVRYAIWKLAKTADKDSNNDKREGYFAQTNNKNPILHLITRSVKQKARRKRSRKWERGRNKLSKRRLLASLLNSLLPLTLPLPLLIAPPHRYPLAWPSTPCTLHAAQGSRLKVTQVFCLIYCIFYAEMRKNFEQHSLEIRLLHGHPPPTLLTPPSRPALHAAPSA